ncbi:MAG TPA: DoxX family protein [Hymenobacter sp.]|uniref:DoxX family protein n=1 Tax=Hymenobacter sp. TaxID=1898978 RepID=UPI002ED823B8
MPASNASAKPIQHPSRARAIAYWASTGLLAFGMVAGGLGQVLGAEFNVQGMDHLGYPRYFLPLIGTWKILGALVILLPGFALVKEWAYAGFFFAMTGAVISHLASGDTLPQFVASLVFAILTVLSWYLRPADRKIPSRLAS